MTSDSPAAARHGADVPVTPWQRALLWLGVPLCVAGLVANRLWLQWHEGRFAELLILAIASFALAAFARRGLRWPLASGLAIVWLLALVFFSGVLPAVATTVFALAALSLGSLFDRDAPVAARTACGLMLSAGVLGWLLPLPVHYRLVYLGACLALIAWRWRLIAASAREAASKWHRAVDAAPRPAAFAVIALGLASTACWLPTLQADDVVYHLRLPWQLVLEHRYPLQPGLHIWSMAPWAADVLQAVPQVMSGTEARGGMNALWIILTAAGVWQLALALGGSQRAAWLAVALYASLPLTAGLAGGMQTEAPTTALLVWLVWTILQPGVDGSRRLLSSTILLGGMLGLKLASAAFALLLVPFALWRHRRLPSVATSIGAASLILLVAGSSYIYAGSVARNPFLPLFNAWFQSPYYDTVNFDDARWHAGFDTGLPWNLTFHTDRYLEAFAGGGGFVLVALAGAWLLAFSRRRTFAVALLATAMLMLPLIPMQYLRYVFPALVLMLPVLAVTATRFDPRRAAWLLIGVCVLNLAFQANSFWLLRIGLVKMAIQERGRDEPLFRAYAPERSLLAIIRSQAHGNVLALDPDRPFAAELGIHGRSVSGYDRALQRSASIADQDPSGAAWADLLLREGVSDVLINPVKLTSAQRAGLDRANAAQRAVQGEIEWWHIPAEATR